MAKRDPGANHAARRSDSVPSGTFVPVSRGWLVTALLVLSAPWIVVAWVYVSGPRSGAGARQDAGGLAASPVAGGARGQVGPWGQIETAPIIISPPLEYIPAYPEAPPSHVTWAFPHTPAAELRGFLEKIGVDARTREAILATTRSEPKIGGVVATPALETVASLPSDVRARLYLTLGAYPENPRQQSAYRFFAQEPEDWFRGAPLRPETLSLVRPLLYRNAGFLLFADMEVVRSRLTDESELRRLHKVLFRQSTLIAKLRIPKGVSTDTVAEYWGRGGRRTDLRPLLESVATLGDEFRVDVAHLLPTFARQHLYRYPPVTLADFDRPELANCFWTAFNFFNDPPDDRLLDLRYVLATLRRDYYLVHADLQLGDLVLYADENESYYHAMVYVADGLVFGKNGNSTLSPWSLLPIERVRGYYPQQVGGRIEYFRRKGL
jgi:hypothetical protein